MTDFTLKDVLEAERKAAERIRQAEAEAERIRREGRAAAERIVRETETRIDAERRRRADEARRDVEEARRKAEIEATALIAMWEKAYNERREQIAARIVERLTGQSKG
jgi:vacuolar-type H+-ATPase subunit H